MFGLIGGLFRGAGDLVSILFGDRGARRRMRHAEILAGARLDAATLHQFAAEFQANRQGWWSRFIDGLNRLPRPLLTFAVIGLFVLAPLDPRRFLEISEAFALIPAGMWALLSVIVGFYFGGRLQLKAQDFAVRGGAAAAARSLAEAEARLAEAFAAEEPLTEAAYRRAMADGASPLPNRVIAEWNRRHGGAD